MSMFEKRWIAKHWWPNLVHSISPKFLLLKLIHMLSMKSRTFCLPHSHLVFGFPLPRWRNGSLNPGTSFFSSDVPSEESTWDLDRSLEFDSHGPIYQWRIWRPTWDSRMHAQGGLCSGEYRPFIVDRTVFGAVPPIRKLFVPEDISGRFDNRSWALKAKVHSWTLSIMRQSTFLPTRT